MTDKADIKAAHRRLKIGYISQHAYDGIGIQLMSGVYDAAKDYDVNLITLVGGTTLTNRTVNPAEITVIKLLNSNSIDGLISWASSFRHYMDINDLDLFHHRFHSLPLVTIAMPMTGIPSILVDNHHGIETLMDHLIKEHGCRKIGFIQGNKGHFYSDERFEAYLKSLSKYQIPYDPNLVAPTADITKKEAIKAAQLLFDERGLIPGRDIEALLTISDLYSEVAIEELKKRGFKIPRDILVVGFNNRQDSFTVSPPLTTIDPNFYRHGYLALESLLAIIRGEKAPERIYVPTTLILRQSCGCFEDSVIKAKTSDKIILSTSMFPPDWNQQITAQRNTLIQTLRNCFNDSLSVLGPEALENLLASFFDHLQNDSSNFLYTFEEYLSLWKKSGKDLVVWENFISELRRLLLPSITNLNLLRRIEDTLHQTRVMVFKALEYIPPSFEESNLFSPNDMAQLGGVFNSTLDIEELLDSIARELPKMGIPGCYLALYEDPLQPAEAARLILAFNENGRVHFEEEPVYPSSWLVPEGSLPENERYSLLVESCYHKDHQLGFVIFKLGPRCGTLYEILRTSFSSALYGALLTQERTRAEREREKLLKVLEVNNRLLEEKNADNKRVNEQLRLAIDEANRANEAKSVFLTNMSHEMRTPLNCILGFAEVAADAAKPEEQRSYLSLIVEESEKLLELINQLLDISKIEAGKLKIQSEPFDFYHLMESITSTFAMSAKNKGLYYQLHLAEDVPQFMKGDPLRLRQILVNLIGNAVKFTNQGGIEVKTAVKNQTDGKITLLFEIRDTGIGIPPDRQKAIFDTFVQAESSTTRKYGGTGLGTAIAKQLAQLMDGEIGVESEVGKGSNFWFTVVMNKIQTAEQPPSPRLANTTAVPELEGKIKILLAEDYPTNQKIVLAYLSDLQAEITVADNGRHAVAKFLENEYDLILMDIQMPEIDGYEATRQIRGQPKGKTIPIIAMTANAFETDAQKCFSVGMNDVITKPFRRNLLLEKITYWVFRQKNDIREEKGLEVKTEEHQPSATLAAPIDFPKILEEFENDRDLVVSIIREFIANSQRQIRMIAQAIQAKECETVWKEAHSIKGGALNLAANRLGEFAFQLEQSGKTADLSKSVVLLSSLKEELNRLEKFIVGQY